MDESVEITPDVKTDWNKFQDHLGGDYPTVGALSEFNGKNPKSQLTEEHIPAALNYISSIKTNPDIQGLTPAYKNGSNMRFPVTADGKHPDLGNDPTAIPKPDYTNPASRMQYAKQFSKKYGPLMEGRGDTPLRINEKPDEGTDTAKNLITKAAQPLGIDPTLLYSSNMEEGMSGLFANKKGESDFSGDKDFPTQGSANFGLDHFVSDFPALVKKGYLPASFKDRFKPAPSADQSETQDSANYKSPDDAIQASAARLKYNYDQVNDLATKKGIQLSQRQKDFFALATYNAGYGNAKKMLEDYQKAGVLKDDSFIDKRPTSGPGLKETSWKQVHQNVSRRIKMAEALKAEQLF